MGARTNGAECVQGDGGDNNNSASNGRTKFASKAERDNAGGKFGRRKAAGENARAAAKSYRSQQWMGGTVRRQSLRTTNTQMAQTGPTRGTSYAIETQAATLLSMPLPGELDPAARREQRFPQLPGPLAGARSTVAGGN